MCTRYAQPVCAYWPCTRYTCVPSTRAHVPGTCVLAVYSVHVRAQHASARTGYVRTERVLGTRVPGTRPVRAGTRAYWRVCSVHTYPVHVYPVRDPVRTYSGHAGTCVPGTRGRVYSVHVRAQHGERTYPVRTYRSRTRYARVTGTRSPRTRHT